MSEKTVFSAAEISIAVGLLFLFLFASPLTDWWSAAGLPWFFPYLVWLLAIVLVWLIQRRKHDV